MRTGFWEAPEGGEADLSARPVGIDMARPAWAATAALATRDAEQWRQLCPRAAELLPQLADALAAQKAAEPGRLFDIFDFPNADRELIAQVLGEGEVTGIAALPDGIIAHIQESVMAGLWRVRFTDIGGAVIADYLEIAAVPHAVSQAAQLTSTNLQFGPPPAGTMNVMPVLAEIRARMAEYRSGDPAHIITFSLFPMSETDMQFLQDTLGDGPVRLISRGYGTCRVLATGARNVWSVQYYNATDAIILDTIEIGGVPQVVWAADDDLHDSAERLREIHEAYFT